MSSDSRLTCSFACAALVAACGKSSPPPSPQAATPPITISAPSVTSTVEPAMLFGTGFTYDETDRIDGHDDWVTIRLGDDVRIWYRPTSESWVPATLALLDEAGAAVLSVRVDMPPSGAITGVLPEPSQRFTQVRFCWVTDGLDAAGFERRIGIAEQELPNSFHRSPRAMAIGITGSVQPTNPSADLPEDIRADSVSIVGEQTVPMNIVIDLVHQHSITRFIGPWGDAPRPISDERWFTSRLKRYMDDPRSKLE